MSTEAVWAWGAGDRSRRRAQIREACLVLVAAATLAVLFGVVVPWIDMRLNPPFGRFWPWLGRSKVPTLAEAPLVFFKSLLLAFLLRAFVRRTERPPEGLPSRT